MDTSETSSTREAKSDDRSEHDNNDTIATNNQADTPTGHGSDLEKGVNAEREGSVAQPSEKEQFQVKWDENDPKNPRNWGSWYKVWLTLVLGMLAFDGSMGSSIIAPAEDVIAKDFGLSHEVTVLTVALYVLGFALGPSLWAPLAEAYGRRVSILPAVFILGLFSIGTATSQSGAAILVTRLFGGIFGSAPISNVSAALGDLYAPETRGTAVTFYAIAVVGGPTIGPVIGSALTVTLGWRWTEYIQAIWTFFMVTVGFFCLPETYAPVLLKRKAKRMRKETGDDRYWHPHEAEKITPSNILTKHVSRPLRMLLTEPMVMAIALYASFVYGILYLTLEVFPIVFKEKRGWELVPSTLPFLALLVGVISAMGVNLANQPRYKRLVAQNNGRAVPEARLPPMIIGGWLFVIGLFWFGWTADPGVPWPACVVAAGFIGAGFNIIFQQCINFLVDSYGMYAASATSANTFLRSLLACGMPLAATPMFDNLGVGPAASLLGGIACLALPVPWIFMKYGARLRKKSKFAPYDD